MPVIGAALARVDSLDRGGLLRLILIVERGPAPWSSPLTRLRWARAGADLRAGLGEIGLEQGRPDLARHDLEQALHRYEQLSHAESEDVSILLNNLGVVYDRLGMAAESVACLLRAVDIDRNPCPIRLVSPGTLRTHW